MAFSPDGKTTTTGGGGIVQVWDTAHGGHIRDIAGNNLLAFSPDGKLLTAYSIEAPLSTTCANRVASALKINYNGNWGDPKS